MAAHTRVNLSRFFLALIRWRNIRRITCGPNFQEFPQFFEPGDRGVGREEQGAASPETDIAVRAIYIVGMRYSCHTVRVCPCPVDAKNYSRTERGSLT